MLPLPPPPSRTLGLRARWSGALVFAACATRVAGSLVDQNVEPPIFGGPISDAAFQGWLGVWRGQYRDAGPLVPELGTIDATTLPKALRGVRPKVVISSGGVAGGIVSEGMGYALMVEGFQAGRGSAEALSNGLGIARAWLSIATSPGGASGLPVWKYPTSLCSPGPCRGTAIDGDEDAVLGLIYLAAALQYPPDLVEWVMKLVIAFAVVDLGFPDLFRSLPDGTRVFVPKGGSEWGGLAPPSGQFATTKHPWCYGPSYFAPAHYRVFRDFVAYRWEPHFNSYLPSRLSGEATSREDLQVALHGAITAGYNLLYYASCESGAVSNWVGSSAPCASADALSCAAVPWATTPYIGYSGGNCSASGTPFGSYGADASRTPWRIAMDYSLYSGEANQVSMYDRFGRADASLQFNAKVYLNRIVRQYKEHAGCACGPTASTCIPRGKVAVDLISKAFSASAPGLTCAHVPNPSQNWWSAYMSYPTFTAFVAPLEGLERDASARWLEILASICAFPGQGEAPEGLICSSTYFDLGQEVISSMIMAGALANVPNIIRSVDVASTSPDAAGDAVLGHGRARDEDQAVPKGSIAQQLNSKDHAVHKGSMAQQLNSQVLRKPREAHTSASLPSASNGAILATSIGAAVLVGLVLGLLAMSKHLQQGGLTPYQQLKKLKLHKAFPLLRECLPEHSDHEDSPLVPRPGVVRDASRMMLTLETTQPADPLVTLDSEMSMPSAFSSKEPHEEQFDD
mmetsp:Transcript_104227/g.293416  ORF Transcript_104227/g.293416 Transcript_104227/m.293416 type:complete len:742 (+) Transcript_104227:73-2298(+)